MIAVVRFSLKRLLLVVAIVAYVLSLIVFIQWARTPSRLIEAAYHGDVDTVRNLVAHGAPVTARDSWSGTPLSYASSRGNKEIVELLLKAGADINERSRLDRTPTMWASRTGQ